jgi:hypothetical protein
MLLYPIMVSASPRVLVPVLLSPAPNTLKGLLARAAVCMIERATSMMHAESMGRVAEQRYIAGCVAKSTRAKLWRDRAEKRQIGETYGVTNYYKSIIVVILVNSNYFFGSFRFNLMEEEQ